MINRSPLIEVEDRNTRYILHVFGQSMAACLTLWGISFPRCRSSFAPFLAWSQGITGVHFHVISHWIFAHRCLKYTGSLCALPHRTLFIASILTTGLTSMWLCIWEFKWHQNQNSNAFLQKCHFALVTDMKTLTSCFSRSWSPSWMLQSCSCSSLTWRSSGSRLHCCLSGSALSSLQIRCCGSSGGTETPC